MAALTGKNFNKAVQKFEMNRDLYAYDNTLGTELALQTLADGFRRQYLQQLEQDMLREFQPDYGICGIVSNLDQFTFTRPKPDRLIINAKVKPGTGAVTVRADDDVEVLSLNTRDTCWRNGHFQKRVVDLKVELPTGRVIDWTCMYDGGPVDEINIFIRVEAYV